MTGKLFGDKGYLSQALREALWEQGIELFTKRRRNMKPIDIDDVDKLLLRKRALIETVNDPLKNISQIEHSRHRSLANFMVNLVTGLTAYPWQPKKPSLKLRSSTVGQHELAWLTCETAQLNSISHCFYFKIISNSGWLMHH